MSPRRNFPRRGGASRRVDDAPALDGDRVRRGVESVQAHQDGEWMVRAIPGGAATKTYRCPGCDQEIRPGMPHVVVWPADVSALGEVGGQRGPGDLSDRRHWHTGCWRGRHRRAPIIRRFRSR